MQVDLESTPAARRTQMTKSGVVQCLGDSSWIGEQLGWHSVRTDSSQSFGSLNTQVFVFPNETQSHNSKKLAPALYIKNIQQVKASNNFQYPVMAFSNDQTS